MMEHVHVFALTIDFPSLSQLVITPSAKESEALYNVLCILKSSL